MPSRAIGPVCAPEYLAQAAIRAPEDLENAILLATRTRPEAWSDWQKTAHLEALDLEPRSTFDHFYLLIQAAAFGLGMAVVPRMLVLEQIRLGRLVAPFGFNLGPRRTMLWIARHLATRPDAIALEKWLVEEMQSAS